MPASPLQLEEAPPTPELLITADGIFAAPQQPAPPTLEPIEPLAHLGDLCSRSLEQAAALVARYSLNGGVVAGLPGVELRAREIALLLKQLSRDATSRHAVSEYVAAHNNDLNTASSDLRSGDEVLIARGLASLSALCQALKKRP